MYLEYLVKQRKRTGEAAEECFESESPAHCLKRRMESRGNFKCKMVQGKMVQENTQLQNEWWS